MNTAHSHIPEDDLALFALALMPAEEAAYAQAHLKHCDQCRGEVARMQGDLVGYAFTADMQDPPPATRARLLDAVAREKKLHTPAVEPVLAPRSSVLLDRGTRDAHEPARTRGGFGFFGWAGWALAACALAVAGWQFYQGFDLRQQLAQQTAMTRQTAAVAERNAAAAQQNAQQAQTATAAAQRNSQEAQNNAATARQSVQQARQTAEQAQLTEEQAARARQVLQLLTDPAVMQVALHLTPAGKTPPRPEGRASYDANRGELVFVASHLNPLQAGKTYELWILPASGTAPVAAGLFRPDVKGNAAVVLPLIPAHLPAKGFGVTIENAGGSTTPTLPILLAGA